MWTITLPYVHINFILHFYFSFYSYFLLGRGKGDETGNLYWFTLTFEAEVHPGWFTTLPYVLKGVGGSLSITIIFSFPFLNSRNLKKGVEFIFVFIFFFPSFSFFLPDKRSNPLSSSIRIFCYC